MTSTVEYSEETGNVKSCTCLLSYSSVSVSFRVFPFLLNPQSLLTLLPTFLFVVTMVNNFKYYLIHE